MGRGRDLGDWGWTGHRRGVWSGRRPTRALFAPRASPRRPGRRSFHCARPHCIFLRRRAFAAHLRILAVFAAGLALRAVERHQTGDQAPEQVLETASAEQRDEIATAPTTAPAHMAGAASAELQRANRTHPGSGARAGHRRAAIAELPALRRSLVHRPPLPRDSPAAVLAGLLGSKRAAAERGLLCWFGIRGIGSVYYLMYAATGAWTRQWPGSSSITLTVIAVSIILHGITVTPLAELAPCTPPAPAQRLNEIPRLIPLEVKTSGRIGAETGVIWQDRDRERRSEQQKRQEVSKHAFILPAPQSCSQRNYLLIHDLTLKPVARIELATCCLRNSCSTTELHWRCRTPFLGKGNGHLGPASPERAVNCAIRRGGQAELSAARRLFTVGGLPSPACSPCLRLRIGPGPCIQRAPPSPHELRFSRQAH